MHCSCTPSMAEKESSSILDILFLVSPTQFYTTTNDLFASYTQSLSGNCHLWLITCINYIKPSRTGCSRCLLYSLCVITVSLRINNKCTLYFRTECYLFQWQTSWLSTQYISITLSRIAADQLKHR